MQIILTKEEFATLILNCNESYCSHCALKEFCNKEENTKQEALIDLCEIQSKTNITIPTYPIYRDPSPIKPYYDDGLTCEDESIKRIVNGEGLTKLSNENTTGTAME